MSLLVGQVHGRVVSPIVGQVRGRAVSPIVGQVKAQAGDGVLCVCVGGSTDVMACCVFVDGCARRWLWMGMLGAGIGGSTDPLPASPSLEDL